MDSANTMMDGILKCLGIQAAACRGMHGRCGDCCDYDSCRTQQAMRDVYLLKLLLEEKEKSEPLLTSFLAALETIAGRGCEDAATYAADVLTRAAGI